MRTDSKVHPGNYTAAKPAGFTLVELIVAIAITSILMLAIGSAIVVATHALPDNNGPAGAVIAASDAAEQIATELQYAVSINQNSATMIEFTVADRDGNDVDEIIRYEWSGTAGDPLTRRYNGGTVVNVLDSVRQFALTYDTETISEEIPQGNESGETLHKQYQPTEDLHAYPIKDNEWYAQYFVPSLPGDAVSWKVTRVRVRAREEGAADGQSRVQLQLPTAGGSPSGIVLEEKTLLESTLQSYFTTQEFTFSTVADLPPDQGLCLVIKWVANGTACEVLGRDDNAYPGNTKLLKSTNMGASWSVRSGESLWFTIYGTVTTAGTPQIDETHYVRSVEVKLRSGLGEQSDVRTRVKTLNQPEVTP